MLFGKSKDKAITIHEKAVEKYNETYKQYEKAAEKLYNKRKESIILIQEAQTLINSIANTPKEFNQKISKVQQERQKFKNTEAYAQEAFDAAFSSGAGTVAGIAGGAAVASMAPSAAMWVATTFGTASTGTAISALHGAAATKAALAWLGGGTLATGGAGIAGGQALLALAGPLGWGVAGVATTVSALSVGAKNNNIANKAIDEAKKITYAGAELNEINAKIGHLSEETILLINKLHVLLTNSSSLKGSNYLSLSSEKQFQLGTIVNNTLSLAELLNKTI